MAKFQVLRVVDAYVRYTAEVEADNPTDAAEKARKSEDDYQWEHDSTSEYDARFFVTLDDEGNEIENTQTGDM